MLHIKMFMTDYSPQSSAKVGFESMALNINTRCSHPTVFVALPCIYIITTAIKLILI